jgi:hypothetical protein
VGQVSYVDLESVDAVLSSGCSVEKGGSSGGQARSEKG